MANLKALLSGFQPFLPALKDNVEKVNAAVEAERQRLEEQKRQLEEQEKLLKERQKKAEQQKQQQQQQQQQQAATSTQTSKEIPSAGKSGSKYLLSPPLICFNYYSKYFIKCSTTISKITR